jgi:hypothetical protein
MVPSKRNRRPTVTPDSPNIDSKVGRKEQKSCFVKKPRDPRAKDRTGGTTF